MVRSSQARGWADVEDKSRNTKAEAVYTGLY